MEESNAPKADLNENSGVNTNIFKIKKLDNGETKIEIDKRKTISPFNSAKHLKYATKGISAFCDTCKYRSIESGGRGGCPKYEAGSVCTIRADTKKLCTELDTRNPDTIEWMLDTIIKEGFESVMLSYAQAKIDGNIPDKNTRQEIDSFVKRLQLWNELRSKTILRATETKRIGSDGEVESIFSQLMATKESSVKT